MKKTCENCGKEFSCTHDEKCWCANFVISHELSLYLKEKFKDCLCSECLEKNIINEKKIFNNKN
ncbi:MAG: cysteine-rich CWC family protein [Bacteroidales bacterium]|jgi:hypothetical protein|nr:cysteine-rich CWC family protein [Bacteroidales bacterium]MDY0143303.1 cysteine-rich CWC family protein [Bacteroidales bacterium]